MYNIKGGSEMKKTYMKPVLKIEKGQPESIICASKISANTDINYDGGGNDGARVIEQGNDSFWDDEW